MININFSQYQTTIMQALATFLITLGILVLVVGTVGGLAFWVYTLAETNQWPLAVVVSGTSLITIGYIIRFIFRIRK